VKSIKWWDVTLTTISEELAASIFRVKIQVMKETRMDSFGCSLPLAALFEPEYLLDYTASQPGT
jgi:hypothetical protein